MTDKIYSKIENKLLHLINRKKNINSERHEIIESENYLQCATMKLPFGKTFLPHKHIVREVTHKNYIPQESWVVIEGSVKCFFFDLDDSLIETVVLYPGDASFTLCGGHTYEILEPNTIIYEFKTGPYLGQQLDKKMI